MVVWKVWSIFFFFEGAWEGGGRKEKKKEGSVPSSHRPRFHFSFSLSFFFSFPYHNQFIFDIVPLNTYSFQWFFFCFLRFSYRLNLLTQKISRFLI